MDHNLISGDIKPSYFEEKLVLFREKIGLENIKHKWKTLLGLLNILSQNSFLFRSCSLFRYLHSLFRSC